MSCQSSSYPVIELRLPQYGYQSVDYYWYTVPDETDIDPDTGEPVREPVDLTGYTARMTVRSAYGAAEVFTLTTGGSGITLGTTDGKITIVFDEDNTALLVTTSTIKSYVADLLMINGSGNPHRLLDFIILPRPGATQLP